MGNSSDFLLKPEQISQGSPLGFEKFQLSSNALKTPYRGKSRSLITNLETVSIFSGRIFRNSIRDTTTCETQPRTTGLVLWKKRPTLERTLLTYRHVVCEISEARRVLQTRLKRSIARRLSSDRRRQIVYRDFPPEGRGTQ